jgi:hypothetical protein
VHHSRNTDPARVSQTFKASSDIDAVAMDILALDNYIAQVDTYTK